MSPSKFTRRLLTVALVALVLGSAGCGDDESPSAAGEGSAPPLVGLFAVNAGTCDASGSAGSWFRMVQPGGTIAAGPFVTNGDSSCADKTITPLTPGADGGLRTGEFQGQPEPPFDPDGNSVSGRIVVPQKWFAVSFGLATNKTDPQTSATAKAPRITRNGDKLGGQLEALAASWNGQHFNQGAPKPGGERPGLTAGPSGTYDEASGRYTLEWSSQIVGGPFSNFTGIWHLEGTFQPSNDTQEES
ncbi:MAG TPA: hypothetical protein VMY88_06215 [Acidimicrobiales bacterium]|nr:hypothetical protein [Acidimicrobiales bacterium]